MITIINSRFESQVSVASDTEFVNCEFAAKGTNAKDKVFGIEVTGDAKLSVKESKFNNTGYSAVHMCSTGDVVLEDNKFNCVNVYNPVEGAVGTGSTKNVSLKRNAFNGVCGNNYVNLYKMEEGSQIKLEGNEFNGISADAEVIRISNPNNAHVNFEIANDSYTIKDENPTDWTAYILCQDYTRKSGNPQDFTKVNVDVDSVLCNGKKLTQEGPCMGELYIVFDDEQGVLTGQGNDPVVIVK